MTDPTGELGLALPLGRDEKTTTVQSSRVFVHDFETGMQLESAALGEAAGGVVWSRRQEPKVYAVESCGQSGLRTDDPCVQFERCV